MKNQITCLFITPYFSPNIGGVETHFDDLLSWAAKNNIKYLVPTYQPLTAGNPGLAYEEKGPHHIYRMTWFGQGWFQKLEKLPFFEFLYLFPGEFFLSFKLALIHRKQIALIHSQGFIAGIIAIIISKLFGFKAIFTDHTLYQTLPQSLSARIFAFIANHHDHILAVAPSIKKELISWGVNANKITVFRYWADNRSFTPQTQKRVRAKLGLPTGKTIILNVARLDPAKGLDILVKIAELVRNKFNNVIFYLINSAQNTDEFLKFINKNSLPKNMVFVGRIPYQNLNDWYAASDYLIITSRREGYTRAAIEAMLCGTPVIASGIGALQEVLPTQLSVISSQNDAFAFYDRISSILSENKNNTHVRRQVAEFARANFSESNGQIIFNCYQEVLQNN